MNVLFSDVYCQGDLLDMVQLKNVYSKSSVFVNMKMNKNETDLLHEFHTLKVLFNDVIPTYVLQQFIRSHFHNVTLENWIPPDFKNYQPIFEYLKDNTYKLVFNYYKMYFKYLCICIYQSEMLFLNVNS